MVLSYHVDAKLSHLLVRRLRIHKQESLGVFEKHARCHVILAHETIVELVKSLDEVRESYSLVSWTVNTRFSLTLCAWEGGRLKSTTKVVIENSLLLLLIRFK
jgi:hypothetical protein